MRPGRQSHDRGVRIVLASLIGLAAFLAAHTPAAAQVPVASFDWSMPDRFGLVRPDTLIEYHWDASKAKYQEAWVLPESWHVDLDACRSSGAAKFTWRVLGKVIGPTDKCKQGVEFPQLRSYPVELTVTGRNGSASVTRKVVVKDWLIVSLGDSFASGEGNPDVVQRL